MTLRVAQTADAAPAAELLHAFNREFDTPTADAPVLAERLRAMLIRDDVLLLLAGEPPVGLALLTFRPVVWDPGPVALLEELYVQPPLRDGGIGSELLSRAMTLAGERGTETFEINVDEGDVDAQRFYERHGFARFDPETGDRALYFHRRLA